MLDLTSLTYQPTTKSSNRSGYPKKHVIHVMSERKPANLDHAPDMHEEENEGDKPLVRPTARKDPLEEGRDQGRTALNFVVCPSQLGGTLCRLAPPIQKSLFR